MIEYLAEVGPRVGVPALRAAFPDVQRAELHDLLLHYRAIYRAKDEMAETMMGVLTGLFNEHGPPLVLKLDNGPAFRAAELQKLLVMWSVLVLHSPSYDPSYNGSAEAGVGSMKARTEESAERAGHPGLWTLKDAERARQEANTFSTSPVDPRRSPQQIWDARVPLEPAERQKQAAEVNRLQAEERAKQEAELQTGAAGKPTNEATWRRVMHRALGALGYLFLRWRRISPPI